MSRYYDGDDYPDYNNAFELWQANLKRALTGKRGRRALTELREALLALPEAKLIDSALCTVTPDKRAAAMDKWSAPDFRDDVERQGEGVCAVGAYLWHRKVKAGADPVEAFDSLPTYFEQEDDNLHRTADLAKREAGMAYTLASHLAYLNDETFGSLTPQERHARYIEWIDEQLGVPS